MSSKASRAEIASWCLYDFADSSFTTLIVTVAYALYFRSVVAGHLGAKANFYWGLCIALSMTLVALTSPALGAMADVSGRKKAFLAAFALTAIVFTALLASVGPGDLLAGMLLFIFANIGYEGAHTFYNGFLPEIASDQEMGRVSGYGWATGYLGGLAALVLTRPLTRAGLGPEAIDRYRLAFPAVALFYLAFALPIFFVLRERAPRGQAALGATVRESFRRLAGTFGQVRRLRDLFLYLVAFFVYNDTVMTVISFAAIYATQAVGFTVDQVTLLFIVMQVTAFAGALATGHLVDRWGAKPTIVLTLFVWGGVVAGASLSRSVPVFFAVATAASIVMGATQAASRSLMGLLIPRGRNAEFFGFYAFTGKISAIIGPLVYGWVAAHTGSDRRAVLSLLPFLALGLILLLRVDVARGRAAAGHPPEARGAGGSVAS